MIQGIVNARREAVVCLRLRGPGGIEADVDAIVDSGFTSSLTLPATTVIALGPVILPLVIKQLANPQNFLALQLYDAIQANEKLLVQFEPDDERILEGEQGRAQRVVQTWFANQ